MASEELLVKDYDILVVGCGFAGTICARKLADSGKKVLILEKRDHIAGNMYDALDSQGILVHLYGPHIFHTNSEEAFNYIKPFSEWFQYQHKVLGSIDNRLVPIPFNFSSIESLFDTKEANNIENIIKKQFNEVERVSILDLIDSSNKEIKKFGWFVFENVFAKYTAKQWGIPIENVDKSVINRVPVILNYDDRYFQDKIQFMPKNGFTELFKNLLDHENIEVRLSTPSEEKIKHDEKENKIYFEDNIWDKPIIYTGAIDEFFGCRFGRLPYRSLDLVFEQKNVTKYQPVAVVNYTISEDYTRITEFKYLTGQDIKDKTTILKEYPCPYTTQGKRGNVPYYPIIEEKNLFLYNKYKDLADKLRNLHLCGRLADYSYYNMDAVIERALRTAEKVIDASKS